MTDSLANLNFGSQYTQIIAHRVREVQVSHKILTTLCLVFLLVSCSPAPNVTVTSQVTVTSTSTFTPARTETPILTETPAPSPTPEIVFHGLITELSQIPTITNEQEQALIQQAIATRSVQAPVDANSRIQISQFVYNDIIFGQGVRIACNPSDSFLIRDTYQTILHTDQGDLPVRKVLIELFVTFEDGGQGSVIVPLVVDADWGNPNKEIDNYTQFRLQKMLENLGSKKIDFRIATMRGGNSRPPNNPVIDFLFKQIDQSEETQLLLDKAHRLAQDNKFLSQKDLTKLLNSIIWW